MTKKEKRLQAPDRVRCVPPGQLKGAGDVSGFVGHIFVELGQGGGGGQVQGEPLVDRPRVGDVLNYAQRTRLLGSVVDLDNYWKKINYSVLLNATSTRPRVTSRRVVRNLLVDEEEKYRFDNYQSFPEHKT